MNTNPDLRARNAWPARASAMARASVASESARQSSDHLRVLLVDDNPAILARARAALASACEIVGAVNDGHAALHAAADLHPDVVVLDISMPDMSGFDVASCLRKAGSTAPVVFLTVHDEEEFVEAANQAGGIGYVLKSRLAVDLMKAVREARDGHPFVSPKS